MQPHACPSVNPNTRHRDAKQIAKGGIKLFLPLPGNIGSTVNVSILQLHAVHSVYAAHLVCVLKAALRSQSLGDAGGGAVQLKAMEPATKSCMCTVMSDQAVDHGCAVSAAKFDYRLIAAALSQQHLLDALRVELALLAAHENFRYRVPALTSTNIGR